MNHLRWMGHSTTIMDIQRSLRYDTDSCEVTLATKEHNIKAHRFVLSSCSDFLRAALADLPLGEECTLIIPDLNGNLLESVISFIYMGETNLLSSQLTEFLEAINILGIKSAISFEYSPSNIDTSGDGGSAIEESIKALTDIQMAPLDIIEEDADDQQKMDNMNESTSDARSLEFYDVYTEPQTKIGYAIEHIPTTSPNQYIFTESSGTYTLTQATKINTSTATTEATIEEIESDEIDPQLIEEEYTNVSDPVIEVADNPDNGTIRNIKSSRHSTNSMLDSADDTDEILDSPHLKKEHMNSITSSDSISPFNDISAMSDFNAEHEYKLMKTEDNLEMAVQAVINEGYSLAKAANKYEVSKTVLWRRVRKNPNYMKHSRENPIFTEAYARLSKGDSLKAISKELDIPMSTLHRHKVRLSQQGRLPLYVSVKKRESMSKEELKDRLGKAVSACVHDGMSQNQAANIFNIPKSTLWRHLQRRVAEAELQLGDIKDEVILS